MLMWGLGAAGGALAGWGLLQLFSGEHERVAIFSGGVGRFYNLAAIAFGAAAAYWLLVRPFTVR